MRHTPGEEHRIIALYFGEAVAICGTILMEVEDLFLFDFKQHHRLKISTFTQVLQQLLFGSLVGAIKLIHSTKLSDINTVPI